MALYWPAFDFSYSLDMPRLLPYIAAIEGFNAAASNGIMPPQWRERPAVSELETSIPAMARQPDGSVDEIQWRKYQLLLTNASRAHAWVRQRFVRGNAILCVEDICHIHRLVAEEAGTHNSTPGEMRAEGFQVITGSPGIGYHLGAPPLRLPRLMQQYIEFVNSGSLNAMPPAIHAMIAHFFITTIHPFADGNGRVSRLVAAAILFQRGYTGHGFYALSNYFYLNEERYHRILYNLQQDLCPNLTEFVAFGMEGLLFELQGINSFLQMKLQRSVNRSARPFRAKGESVLAV